MFPNEEPAFPDEEPAPPKGPSVRALRQQLWKTALAWYRGDADECDLILAAWALAEREEE